MNTQANRHFTGLAARYSSGMSLLDVLLAIFVFVIGMLALASLQGNLTRSSTDANARTVGINFAEELLEQYRTFEKLQTTSGFRAYQDLTSETVTETRGGTDYTIDVVFNDYFFMPDGETVTSDTNDLPENQDTTISDFKLVTMSVSWTGGEFQQGDGTQTTGRLGSGSLVFEGIVPSVPPLGAAKVAEKDLGAIGSPPVLYTPGARPDIIAISLGDDRFKESTTPEPIVRRRDELVETWFDVITYSQLAESDAVFLRREEFVAISCECELQAETANAGLLPTVWVGTEYKEGLPATKQYGVGATNQQSQYCDVCCRDHHDTSHPNDEAYRPWDSNGAHPHFSRANNGSFTLAGVGDNYLEACRLVRKDGFFRVAQDFKMEQQIAFPRDFLDDSVNAGLYSDYVIAAAEDHFDSGTSPLMAHSLIFEGDTEVNRMVLPTVFPTYSRSRYLMSRAIYTDAVNDELATTLNDCFGNGDLADCTLPPGTNELEVLPFFDVQVTKLARWSELYPDDPIDITSDDFRNQGYDRGLAELDGSELGITRGYSRMETTNVGLIDTLPVQNDPGSQEMVATVFMRAGLLNTPPPTGSRIVSGTITAAGGTSDAAIAVITGSSGVTCGRPAPGEFSCVIAPLTTSPKITVSNYFRSQSGTPVNLIVCSNNSSLVYDTHVNGTSAITNWTRFSIPTTTTTGASITIRKGTSC